MRKAGRCGSPAPPPFLTGSFVLLVEPAGPHISERAGRGDGRDVLPGPTPRSCWCAGQCVVGASHQATRPRPRRPAAGSASSPASRCTRTTTVLSEGGAGPPGQGTVRAHSGSTATCPRVEPGRTRKCMARRPSARPRRPPLGSPSRLGGKWKELGRRLHLPDGRGHADDRAGAPASDSLDASLSVATTRCSCSRSHPLIRGMLEGW